MQPCWTYIISSKRICRSPTKPAAVAAAYKIVNALASTDVIEIRGERVRRVSLGRVVGAYNGGKIAQRCATMFAYIKHANM